MYQGHSHWIGIGRHGADVTLDTTHRLQALVDQLPSADERCPSLVVLIGHDTRRLFLKHFVSTVRKDCISENKKKRPIQLFLDANTAFQTRPLFYADCPLPCDIASNTVCGKADREQFDSRALQQINGHIVDVPAAAEYVYSRLLKPFSDVFCLFYGSFGSFGLIAEYLVSWIQKGHAAATPVSVHPVLMVVIESDCPGSRIEKETKNILMESLSHRMTVNILDHFSNIEVVAIFCEGRLSNAARLRRLKERIVAASNQTAIHRERARLLFSATHFSRFFKHAYDHFVTVSYKPFDFVYASRLRNTVSSTLEAHLLRFLRSFSSAASLEDIGTTVISSALLLDAYAPEMHVFHPSVVFRTLYREVCLRVARKILQEQEDNKNIILSSHFAELVESQFLLRFQELTDSLGTSALIHQKVLCKFQDNLHLITNRDLCSMMCLQRSPEHKLPCDHMICNVCIQIHEIPTPDDPWSYELLKCPFCHLQFYSRVTIKMHNPVRGLRVLCLDGGGCRAVIPLSFLQILEECIGIPYPVQQNFDVFIGPSSGALLALIIAKIGLRVADANFTLEKFSEEAFTPRPAIIPAIPFLSALVELIISFITGNKYPTNGIESAIKQICGEDLTMFDCSYATAIGAKIAVLVTSVKGCRPFLFPNYRGNGSRSPECGYDVVECQDGRYLPRVSEILRCTSAAPWYFKPKTIKPIGTFQDGGLWMNNPTSLIDSEINVIAPSSGEPLIVSVGTGLSGVRHRTTRLHRFRPWKNGLIYRLYEALMSSMSSKRYWRSGDNYYEFNVNFREEVPGLDDVRQIPLMADTAYEQFHVSSTLPILASRLIAAYFHFELEQEPNQIGNEITIAGHILCDIKHGHPAYEALLDRLSRDGATFYINGKPIIGKIRDRSFVDLAGNVRLRVEFTTSKDTLSICLKTTNSEAHHISKSPFNIFDRVQDQNLDAYFGQANHRKRPRPSQVLHSRRKKRRIFHSR